MIEKRRNLPPLEAGAAYEASDLRKFEYVPAGVLAPTAVLRLHLANGAAIDVPTSDQQIHVLQAALIEAFPSRARALMRLRGWT